MLAIRLPTDFEERLDRLAEATGRTKTFRASRRESDIRCNRPRRR